MKPTSAKLTLLALSCSAALLAACGGGGGGAGGSVSANSGTSTMDGTVSGFGSVIVDGIRIDNHAVTAVTEKEDGTQVATELKLGQHVEVDHDDNLVASAVRVVAEAEGPVDSVNISGGTLTMLGQTITINTDPKVGPVTIFEAPYTSLADVKAGDIVQVHGLIQTDSTGKSTILATRIAQKTPESFNRVAGTIAELSTTAKTFKLGSLLIDYSSAKLLPDGATLANGEEVHVSIPLGTVSAGTAVKAVVVKVRDHSGNSHSKPSELGGAISAVNATSKTLTINGVKVDISAASFNQPGKSIADLKANTYVVVKGVYDTSGVLKATTIVIRGADDVLQSGTVELHGTILNFVSNADFTVRDVHVDASTAKIDTASCGSITTLANNMQVEIDGTLTATGKVTATTVKCETVQSGESIVSNIGTVSKVDLTGKTLTLTTDKGTVSVQWSAMTLFIRADVNTLSGARIEVEGTLTNGVLQATKIELAGS